MTEAARAAGAFIEQLMKDADAGGAHYSPDFRDALHDNRHWVTDRLAELLATPHTTTETAVQGSEVKRIREEIGAAIGRRVSQRDLGLALGLSADNADRLVRKWEDGEPSGPAAVALELMQLLILQGNAHEVKSIMDRSREGTR